MSMITENTAVVKAEFGQMALKDIENDSYFSNADAKIVYENSEIAVIIFDSNGDPIWEMRPEECKLPPEALLALETNYLDGEGPYMWLPDDLEGETRISRWLKGKVSPEDLKQIRKKIAYNR